MKRIQQVVQGLFKKKAQLELPPAQDIVGLVAEVSDSADRLLEAPREMVLPPISPREQIVGDTSIDPSPDVLINTPTPGWRARLRQTRFGRKRPVVDSELSASEVLTQRPIHLFIGYVPDVTEKDARFFAMGVAEKNVESEYISYLGVFKYGEGYAYEIQEGGHGHSYLTRILKYFSQLPPSLHDAETAVYIGTASRMVQVEKSADGGLVCIQLPESYKVRETEWLRPEKKLKLLRDQNSGLMMITGVFLAISLLVLAGAFLTRYTPTVSPTGRVWYDTVSTKELPISQWDAMIQETENSHYILALKYDGKQWCRKTDAGESCANERGGGPKLPAKPQVAPSTIVTNPAPVASSATGSAPLPASMSVLHPLPPLPPMPTTK